MQPHKILITGSNGFIGKNLKVRISEIPSWEFVEFNRNQSSRELPDLLTGVTAVIHLAGENRPKDENDFGKVNSLFTKQLCDVLQATNRSIPMLFTSSTQVERDNLYGKSKLGGEEAVSKYGKQGNPGIIFRLPNVFGKWCKPNYNSAVATFCFNIANDLPIQINDRSSLVNLVYIDDVVEAFLLELHNPQPGVKMARVEPVYSTTVGELADQIYAFQKCRQNLIIEKVGTGLTRALYSTYVSYLPTEKFAYPVPVHGDARGVFVEMLKTKESGQFSYFTAHPGVTRGSHYHHTKTEKFLVIKGKARFGFRHLITNEKFELTTEGGDPQIVETLPGYTHDITNIGDEEMIVMLWANEIFDREKPDTLSSKV